MPRTAPLGMRAAAASADITLDFRPLWRIRSDIELSLLGYRPASLHGKKVAKPSAARCASARMDAQISAGQGAGGRGTTTRSTRAVAERFRPDSQVRARARRGASRREIRSDAVHDLAKRRGVAQREAIAVLGEDPLRYEPLDGVLHRGLRERLAQREAAGQERRPAALERLPHEGAAVERPAAQEGERRVGREPVRLEVGAQELGEAGQRPGLRARGEAVAVAREGAEAGEEGRVLLEDRVEGGADAVHELELEEAREPERPLPH